ncbi:HlyD family secretion protein [Albidovulum sp.]
MSSGLPEWLVAVIATVFPAFGGGPEAGYNGYVDADFVHVAPAEAGRIASISADEGQRVFAGQQLFTLDSTRQRAALNAAEARVHVAEANLANLQTGSRAPEIEVIRAELARAEAELDLARSSAMRTEQLFARGNASQAQLDADRARLASARAQVAELKARLEVAELPARDAQRIAAEATLDAARAEAAQARSALDDRIVLSPETGIVDRRYFDPGEVVGAGVPVLSILPEGRLKAIFFVPEAARAAIAPGDRLRLGCDGCGPGIGAVVTRLAASPQYTPPIIYSREERARLVFRAEARIEGGEGLRPGQPVTLEPAP